GRAPPAGPAAGAGPARGAGPGARVPAPRPGGRGRARPRGRAAGDRRRAGPAQPRPAGRRGPPGPLRPRLRGDRDRARHPARHGPVPHRPGPRPPRRAARRPCGEPRRLPRTSYDRTRRSPADHLSPMTQPQIPDPDELASAVLDGAATPEEAALVAADPALTARVEALRAARDRLRSAEAAPVDPERREIAIAAALAAFDELERGDAGREPVVAPVPLAARRRPGSVPRVWRYVAIAAAIVAGVLVVPLIGGLDGGDEADLEGFASEMPERAP